MHEPLDFRDHPHGQQGVPAQLEEMVIGSNIVPLEQSLPDSQNVELEKGRPAPGLPEAAVIFTVGSGRARRSSLPLGVIGRVLMNTKAEGIM